MPVPLFQRNVPNAASGCPNLILVNAGVTRRRNVSDYMVKCAMAAATAMQRGNQYCTETLETNLSS
jgi:hypothetical protein